MKSLPHFPKYIMAAIFSALFLAPATHAYAVQPSDPFPTYPSLETNIAFWKKVYGIYSTSQGIIHDRRNLDLIYEIIPLEDGHHRGAARSNAKKVKQVKKKYRQLLKALANDRSPVSAEEKRVHALFVDKGVLESLRDAYRNIRFQLGQKDRFRAGIIRSGAYFDEIQQIFKQYGLPQDLAYLPHVESSFNYEAYSKFGAAGIWQFTRGTGRRFMTVDYTVDERRDPIQATHAAAKLLKENHNALGNWPMAITAYNHGTSGMLRAQRSHGDYESVYNGYDGRTFGFASRNFYSEFLAAREVAKSYRLYFGDLELANPVHRHTLAMPGYVSLQDLAGHFQVDEKILKKFNPALRAPVFNGQKYVPKGYLLHLPGETASGPEYVSEIPARLLKDRQKPSRFYRVQRGDTAGQVARAHRVGLNDLILANGLNSRATIYAGQNLRIPVKGERIVLASKLEARTSPKTMTHDPESSETPSEEASTAPVMETGLKKVQPDRLRPVPEEVLQVNPAVVVGNLSVEKVSVRGSKTIGVIQVEPEETLGHYADWLEIPTWQIRKLNGFSYGRPIHVGQKIEIPFDETTREQFEEKRYEYHKEIEEDFFAVYAVEKPFFYQIEQGDNIWTLCQEKFDLPFWLLKKYNAHMDFNRLVPSKILTIPMVSKIGETEYGKQGVEDRGQKRKN